MKRFWPFRTAIVVPVVLLLAALFVGLSGPLLKSAAERAARAALGTEVTFSSVKLGLFSGSLTFADLRVQDKEKPTENLLEARSGTGNLSVWQLLRGRAVIEELLLRGVRFHVERTEDGSLNVETLPKPRKKAPLPKEKTDQAKKTDWVKTLRDVAAKLKKWIEKRRRAEEERRSGKVRRPPAEKVRTGSASYLTLEEPRLVLRRIAIEDMELVLQDRTKKEKLPPLTNIEAEVRNISSDPFAYDPPITFRLSGVFGANAEGGKLSLKGRLDIPRQEPAALAVSCGGSALALTALKPLFGLSLPLRIEKGRATVSADLALSDFSHMELSPEVRLTDFLFSPDGVHDRIAGVPAQDFCEAANRAKSFSLVGLKIDGELGAPRFHYSEEFTENLKNMLLEAGKGALVSEAEKHLGAQAGAIRKKAEKVLGKEAGAAVKKGAGEILKKGLKLIGPFRGDSEK